MAEFIALSSALRDVITIMELMDEFNDRGYDLISTKPIIYCKAFEDNSGALEITRLPKMRPHTGPPKAMSIVTAYLNAVLDESILSQRFGEHIGNLIMGGNGLYLDHA